MRDRAHFFLLNLGHFLDHLFTLVFAVAQTAGPYGAGLVGDLAGNIGVSLMAASGLLLAGAALALCQRPL